jgi:hypothetical protein
MESSRVSCYHKTFGQLGLIDGVDQKHKPFGWIFGQDGVRSGTSQVSIDWLEETVDVIMDCRANSSDGWQMELFWGIYKKLVRRMKRQTLQEQKSALLGSWSSTP